MALRFTKTIETATATLQVVYCKEDSLEARGALVQLCHETGTSGSYYDVQDSYLLDELNILVVFTGFEGYCLDALIAELKEYISKAKSVTLVGQPVQQEQVSYSVKGYVLGNLWDTTRGILPIKGFQPVEGEFGKEVLMQQVANAFQDGKLTGTGDFSSLIGAVIALIETTAITVSGKTFTNVETGVEQVGSLTPEQFEVMFDLLCAEL